MLGDLFPFDWLERALPLQIVKLTRDMSTAAAASDTKQISASEKTCGLLERELDGKDCACIPSPDVVPVFCISTCFSTAFCHISSSSKYILAGLVDLGLLSKKIPADEFNIPGPTGKATSLRRVAWEL